MTRTVKRAAKILVVEDEQIVAMDMELQLTAFGYQVTGIATTGPEALRLAETTSPDLVVMDVQLNGALDGISTAEALQRRSAMPVVFVSAFGSSETQRRAHNASPLGYLTKPFRPEELRALVAAALEQKAHG
ncbi:MAG: response regulator [Acidobacteriaceae bacterium]|nr:response regulator [Acidobacteriaceae bacterium]